MRSPIHNVFGFSVHTEYFSAPYVPEPIPVAGDTCFPISLFYPLDYRTCIVPRQYYGLRTDYDALIETQDEIYRLLSAIHYEVIFLGLLIIALLISGAALRTYLATPTKLFTSENIRQSVIEKIQHKENLKREITRYQESYARLTRVPRNLDTLQDNNKKYCIRPGLLKLFHKPSRDIANY